jgi:hypothetical protein
MSKVAHSEDGNHIDGEDPLQHSTYLQAIDGLVDQFNVGWDHVLMQKKVDYLEEVTNYYYWPIQLADKRGVPNGFAEVYVDPLASSRNANIYSVQHTKDGLVTYHAERYFDTKVGAHVARLMMYTYSGDYEAAYAQRMGHGDKTWKGKGTLFDVKRSSEPLYWLMPPNRIRFEEPVWSSDSHPYGFHALTQSIDWDKPHIPKYGDFMFQSDIVFLPSVNGYFQIDRSGRMAAIVRKYNPKTKSIDCIGLPVDKEKDTDGSSESFMKEFQKMIGGSESPYEEWDEIALAEIGDKFLDVFRAIRKGKYIGQSKPFDKTHLQ